MRAAALGLITGLIAGLALAFGGFSEFLIVLVFGAVGLVVGKVVDGDLDITRYVGGDRRRSRR
ncbi:hypothetical protein FF36_00564 [Frankia torreyi]|uniref:Small integral membrane protein (DUF2273) n=1 Tax=Frankia torreyi TaxID=1856 RepID=A0A0D8BL17_9ACTN|nr:MULTISPECIES: DUF2273 domain-containing protein [Frankia]KJE24953.1 hypothetical protein FF36_00564 [Frankia torreyi]KQC39705.1 hypothetical protein UK82_03430 [Frankia sp. ACN1ag]